MRPGPFVKSPPHPRAVAALLAVVLLGTGCAAGHAQVGAHKGPTGVTAPTSTVPATTRTVPPPLVTTTTDPCETTTPLIASCPLSSPNGHAEAAAASGLSSLLEAGSATTTTSLPPCSGIVSSTITVASDEGGNGATYTFTVKGTVESGRSDPISNVSVAFTYGFHIWTANGSAPIGPIAPGQSAMFTASTTYSPIYFRPVQPTAKVISVTYSDSSGGYGCGVNLGA